MDLVEVGSELPRRALDTSHDALWLLLFGLLCLWFLLFGFLLFWFLFIFLRLRLFLDVIFVTIKHTCKVRHSISYVFDFVFLRRSFCFLLRLIFFWLSFMFIAFNSVKNVFLLYYGDANFSNAALIKIG